MIDYGAMSERELDRACAEFAEPEPGPIPEWFGLTHEVIGEHPRSPKRMYVGRCLYEHSDVPEWEPRRFSTDLNAARELEGEIERRGLREKYAYELNDIVIPDVPSEPIFEGVEWWLMINASARDRAIAFCMTLEAAGRGEE